MSLYCPDGMTTPQCLDLMEAIQNLRGHGVEVCRVIGDEALEQYDGGMMVFDTETEEYWGYSFWLSNGTWLRATALSARHWTEPETILQLQNTIAHEIGGHQRLGEYYSPDPGIHPFSELLGLTCSGVS